MCAGQSRRPLKSSYVVAFAAQTWSVALPASQLASGGVAVGERRHSREGRIGSSQVQCDYRGQLPGMRGVTSGGSFACR
jgi:hypothetical protein